MALQYSSFYAEFRYCVISSYKSTIILFFGTFAEYFMIDDNKLGIWFKICFNEKISIAEFERHSVSTTTSYLPTSFLK